MTGLTQKRLAEVLHYNPDLGEFSWLVGRGGQFPLSVAGGRDLHGYWQISVFGVRYKAHRLAFLYMTGAWPVADVDHINRIRDDNRWKNLREATRAQNVANAPARKNSRSGVRGVCLTPKGWKAQIKVSGKNKHIGYFKSVDAAAEAYRSAASLAFGQFAAI